MIETVYEADVVVDDDLGHYALSIVGRDSRDRIHFEKWLTGYQDDRKVFVEDDYTIERNGASHRGGILRWELVGRMLMMHLAQVAVEALGLPPVIVFPLSEIAVPIVRERFERILDRSRAV